MDPIDKFFNERIDPNLRQSQKELYQLGLESGVLSKETKYQYAWTLVKSTEKKDLRKSIILFKEMMKENDEHLPDCLFFIAYAYIKLKDFSEAEIYCDKLLEIKPRESDAMAMKTYLDQAKNEAHTKMLWYMGVLTALAVLTLFKLTH